MGPRRTPNSVLSSGNLPFHNHFMDGCVNEIQVLPFSVFKYLILIQEVMCSSVNSSTEETVTEPAAIDIWNPASSTVALCDVESISVPGSLLCFSYNSLNLSTSMKFSVETPYSLGASTCALTVFQTDASFSSCTILTFRLASQITSHTPVIRVGTNVLMVRFSPLLRILGTYSNRNHEAQ